MRGGVAPGERYRTLGYAQAETLCPQNSTFYPWDSVYYSEQLLKVTWQPSQSKKMKDSPLLDHCPYNRVFQLFCLFMSSQSALSLFLILSYDFSFFGVNSESEAKLSSFSRECLALGFEEEL
jgi:hypothetical protein